MIDGATPMRASVNANVLAGPATTMSHAPTRPSPPARTCPLTAPMTGIGSREFGAAAGSSSRARSTATSPGSPPGGFREIGARAEGSAGVAEDDGAHPGFLGGVGEALVQLVDQRGRQRVAVVRGVQREAGDVALDRVVN